MRAKAAEKEAEAAAVAERRAEREQRREAKAAAAAEKKQERDYLKLAEQFYITMMTSNDPDTGAPQWRQQCYEALCRRLFVPRTIDPEAELTRLVAVNRFLAKRHAHKAAGQAI
jgi:hypothetical protein